MATWSQRFARTEFRSRSWWHSWRRITPAAFADEPQTAAQPKAGVLELRADTPKAHTPADLESKLDRLLREVDELRREIRKEKPRQPPSAAKPAK